MPTVLGSAGVSNHVDVPGCLLGLMPDQRPDLRGVLTTSNIPVWASVFCEIRQCSNNAQIAHNQIQVKCDGVWVEDPWLDRVPGPNGCMIDKKGRDSELWLQDAGGDQVMSASSDPLSVA